MKGEAVKKKKALIRPRVPIMKQTGQVFLDRRLKRQHTRSQQKATFKKEMAKGEV